MLNSVPTLGFNVALELSNVLVDAQAKDAHLVSPICFPLHKHILIVLHRSLARRAPGGPEVDKNDLALLMCDVNRVTSSERGLLADDAHGIALCDACSYLESYGDVAGGLCELRLQGFDFIFQIC